MLVTVQIQKSYSSDQRTVSNLLHILSQISNYEKTSILKFVKLPFYFIYLENLRVITECGVEVRLESGIIHSPIHYR